MPIDHSGKTALVTGASRGIGEAAARRLAETGANVVLVARSSNEIKRIADEIGNKALAVPCDVASYTEADQAVRSAIKTFGGIDILVNNAGLIDPIARLEDSDPVEWSRVVDVNLKGVYNFIRVAIGPMREKGSGVIINLSSGAATGALEGWSHYCSTKAAVLSLTKCGHKELAEQGIRVVGLSPGTVATDMQTAIKSSGINPVSQLDWSDHIPPEWVGEAIVWLATEAGRPHDGGDFSLKTDEGRKAVGLI